MRNEVFQCCYDAGLDGQLRCPTKGTDPAAVKEDEGIIANPAALAPRVDQLGRNVEPPTNPANRLVDLAIFILAQIEDIDRLGGFSDRNHDRVYAIVDIEVRL